MKFKKFIFILATFSSTIIGVGFFSFPYLASKLGFETMIFYLLIMAAIVLVIHLIFSELVLEAPDYSRFPGFANFYLGKKAKIVSFFTSIFGMIGTLLAYLIVGGEFLKNIFSPIFGGSSVTYILIYFIFAAALIYFGIKAVEKFEFWSLILFFIVLAFIFIKSLLVFDIKNLLLTGQGMGSKIPNLFLAFGPILFSFWGMSIIPEMEERLKNDKQQLKKIILAGILIALLTYFLFIFIVLGISGKYTSSDALSGLKVFLARDVLAIGFLFGVLTTFTSFITIGLTLKKIFQYDLKVPEKISWFIACFSPLMLFFLGFKNFLQVIGFVGGILLAIDGILICLMYQKFKKTKKAKILTFILALIFILAIICEIKYFLIK